MLDSLFDLPLVIVGAAILILLCAFALGGLAIFSRHILPRLKLGPEESVFTSAMMQAVMVFYGLAVALIAVSVWQTYTDAGATTSREATAIGVLYRYMGAYPEPLRSELRKELREYLEYVIKEAWPLQHRGQVPRGGVEQANDVEAKLFTFEPATEGQKLLHERNPSGLQPVDRSSATALGRRPYRVTRRAVVCDRDRRACEPQFNVFLPG